MLDYLLLDKWFTFRGNPSAKGRCYRQVWRGTFRQENWWSVAIRRVIVSGLLIYTAIAWCTDMSAACIFIEDAHPKRVDQKIDVDISALIQPDIQDLPYFALVNEDGKRALWRMLQQLN